MLLQYGYSRKHTFNGISVYVSGSVFSINISERERNADTFGIGWSSDAGLTALVDSSEKLELQWPIRVAHGW